MAETAPIKAGLRQRPTSIGRVCACLLLFLTAALAAQEFVPVRPGDPIGEYLNAIERAESLGGAYAVELVDLYHGLGQSLLEQGDLEGARDAFHQTVMVARVNSGPNSLEQADYLYSIADIEARLRNHKAVLEVLDHIYGIHARQFGEDSPQLLPVVEKIYGWYFDRLAAEERPLLPSDYQNLSYLMTRIAALTEARYGLGQGVTAARYRELGQLHFHAVRHFVATGLAPHPELVLDSEGSSNVALLERSMIAHLEGGEEAFERAVQSWQENPDATELQQAEAMAELGDWYLVFRYFRKARRQYEEAYLLLAQSPQYHRVADEYLGAPAPLAFLNPAEHFAGDLQPGAAGDRLEVSMAVSLTGRLYDIEIVTAPEALSDGDLQTLIENLANTRFRPAVVNGKSQSVEGFVWRALARDAAGGSLSG